MQQIKQKYEETGISFSDNERSFFVDENGYCNLYTNSENVRVPNVKVPLMTDKNRNICLQHFLAYHSFDIGNPKQDVTNHFLYLKFKNDQELCKAMVQPNEFKHLVIWKTEEDFGADDSLSYLAKNLKNIKAGFTGVLLNIFDHEHNLKVYLNAFTIRSYELYVEVELPWVFTKKNIDGSNKNILIYLSCFQKDILTEKTFNYELYEISSGYEPIIVDEEKRSRILNNVCNHVYNQKLLDQIKDETKDQRICVLNFKNGDKTLINTLSGIVRNECVSFKDLQDFENESYFNKLQEFTNVAKSTNEKCFIFVFYVYVPNTFDTTKTILHCSICLKKESEFQTNK